METPELPRRLGDILRIARGDRRQLEISDAVGISDSALSTYERGEVLPSLRTLVKLLNVLGISPEEILAVLLDEPDTNGDEKAA